MPNLPPELYEVIIDYVDGDTDTLRQCALVSHFFARRCQQLLFKSITLARPFRQLEGDIFSRNYPSQRLYKILLSSPHLSQLIQELEISDATLMNFYREELSWIRKDTDLARILPLLHHVQTLAISGNHMGSRLNFRAWKPPLKFAVLRKAPSLSTIYLAYIRNVPWMLFKSVPTLKSLYLHQVAFVPDDSAVLAVDSELKADSKQAQLETLHIKTTSLDEWRSLYLWLRIDAGSFNLDHVTDLTLDVDFVVQESHLSGPEELQSVAWLLQRCSSSLENLDLFFPEEVASPKVSNQTFLDLTTMPRLQQLCLHGCVWSDRTSTGSQDTLRWVVKTLSGIPESTQLSRLTLMFTIEAFPLIPSSRLEQAGWDGLISVIEKLAPRSKIHVHISILGSDGTYVEVVLKERLSRLVKLNMIAINRLGLDDSIVNV